MKTALWIMTMACLAWSPALASEGEQVAKDAMIFEVSEFSLSGFNGGFGWRHHFGAGLALRPGLDVAFRSWEREPTPGHPRAEDEEWTLRFNLAVEKHFATSASVSPYIGVGALVDRSEGVRKQDLVTLPDDAARPDVVTTLETKSARTSYGALAICRIPVALP